MSKGKYGYFEISEEERKRLEEERKRRQEEERRRREEARRREIERRRREEVAAEKERIALAKSFREMALTLQQQQSSPKPKNQRPEREKPDLSQMMREQVQLMKEQLAVFPELWSDYFAARLKVVQWVIHKVEASGFDAFHYHQLKEAGRNLASLAATGEAEIETIFSRVRKVKETCNQLLIEMEIVAENAPMDEHRRQALTIMVAFNSLLQESHPDMMEPRLEDLNRESRSLWERYIRSHEAEQRRHFLIHNVQEVLEEMGYRVLQMAPPSPDLLYFRTPGPGLVEMKFGPEQSFDVNYVLPKSDTLSAGELSSAEIIDDCRSWCRDYDHFIQNLSQRSVFTHEKGRLEPEEGKFKEVTVPDTFFQEEEESFGYWSIGDERDRSLQL